MLTERKVQPDQRPVKLRPYAETVAATWAQLCLDCEKPGTIYDLRFGACPACGSRAGIRVTQMAERAT